MTILHGVDFLAVALAALCALSFLVTVLWSLVSSESSSATAAAPGLVVLTVCNAAWLDLCDNFLLSALAQFANASNRAADFVVVALDSATERHLRSRWPQVAVELSDVSSDQSVDSSVEAKWRSQRYFDVVNVKPRAVRRWLRRGANVLLCDADVVWLQDVALFARRHWFNHTLLFQDDTYGPNTGLFFARANAASVAFLDGWIGFSDKNRNENNDQHMLHRWLETPEGGAARAAAGVSLLDRAQFPVGLEYFKRRSQSAGVVEPWAVHANWIVGAHAKRWALRQQLLWFAPWPLPATCAVTLSADELLDGCNTRECHSAAIVRLVAFALQQRERCFVAVPLLPCTASFAQAHGRTRCSLHNVLDVDALVDGALVPLEPSSVLFEPRFRDALRVLAVPGDDWRRCWRDIDVVNANFTAAALRERLFARRGAPLCQQRSNTL
jgi:hypothetical protein